jgi:hypothetical protein
MSFFHVYNRNYLNVTFYSPSLEEAVKQLYNNILDCLKRKMPINISEYVIDQYHMDSVVSTYNVLFDICIVLFNDRNRINTSDLFPQFSIFAVRMNEYIKTGSLNEHVSEYQAQSHACDAMNFLKKIHPVHSGELSNKAIGFKPPVIQNNIPSATTLFANNISLNTETNSQPSNIPNPNLVMKEAKNESNPNLVMKDTKNESNPNLVVSSTTPNFTQLNDKKINKQSTSQPVRSNSIMNHPVMKDKPATIPTTANKVVAPITDTSRRNDIMNVFESDKKVYKLIKSDIENEKISQSEIHPSFAPKYMIFKVLDSRKNINFESNDNLKEEYKLFNEMYSLCVTKPKETKNKPYVPHNYDYKSVAEKEKYVKQFGITVKEFEDKYVNGLENDSDSDNEDNFLHKKFNKDTSTFGGLSANNTIPVVAQKKPFVPLKEIELDQFEKRNSNTSYLTASEDNSDTDSDSGSCTDTDSDTDVDSEEEIKTMKKILTDVVDYAVNSTLEKKKRLDNVDEDFLKARKETFGF